VQRVTDIIGEISAASQRAERRASSRSTRRSTQLDQMTQQNAALVEQIAAAAAALHARAGAELAQAVSAFRLG
jgi:methyl-accepting chemotaxis protein